MEVMADPTDASPPASVSTLIDVLKPLVALEPAGDHQKWEIQVQRRVFEIHRELETARGRAEGRRQTIGRICGAPRGANSSWRELLHHIGMLRVAVEKNSPAAPVPVLTEAELEARYNALERARGRERNGSMTPEAAEETASLRQFALTGVSK